MGKKRLLFYILFFFIFFLKSFSMNDEEAVPFQNNLPSVDYRLENSLFLENYSSGSVILRAGPEDEDGNGLGLVPVDGQDLYVFSIFIFFYILLCYHRLIQKSKYNK